MEVPGFIDTAHLYAPLHRELVSLLEGLSPDDWHKPTVCRGWAVRDIAAHLLDVDIRRLSFSRDLVDVPAPDPPISSYSDLVAFLNRLNADWLRAARRFSPRVLVDLLRLTGPQVAQYVTTLDMMETARFSVAWAGEDVSANWFDVARDYTERWHHQQQIRDAVGAPPITSAKWLAPVLDAFMRALPYAYRGVQANDGDAITVTIDGEAGGVWTLLRSSGNWQLLKGQAENAAARITLDQDTAWRHLTKGLTNGPIQVEGNANFAEAFRHCLAVMA